MINKKIQEGLVVADRGQGPDTKHQLFLFRQQVRVEIYFTENCSFDIKYAF